MNDDRCVICGGYVPEGRHVCFECEETFSDERFEKLHKDHSNGDHPSDKIRKPKRQKRDEIRGY